MYHSLVNYYGMIHRDTNTWTFFQCQDMRHALSPFSVMAHVSWRTCHGSRIMRLTHASCVMRQASGVPRLMRHASGVRPLASGLWPQASGVRRHASCVRRPTPHASCVRRQASGLWPLASGVRRHASCVMRQASGLRPQASCVRRQASGLRRQASRLWRALIQPPPYCRHDRQ